MALIYLASPYSHPDKGIEAARFQRVCGVAGRLMSMGIQVLSPIAHTHPIAIYGTLPTGWEFWRDYDHALIDVCGELWICKLPGWRESHGVTGEIEYARSTGKPISTIEPDTLVRSSYDLGGK